MSPFNGRVLFDQLTLANQRLQAAAEMIKELTKQRNDAQEAARAQARAEAAAGRRAERAEAVCWETTKALRFYADRQNWRHGQPFGGILGRLTPIEADAGKTARDTLALEPVLSATQDMAVLRWHQGSISPALVKKKDAE